MIQGNIIYYGNRYWYALKFCEVCERFTTHRTDAPQGGGGTFEIYRIELKCLDCLYKAK